MSSTNVSLPIGSVNLTELIGKRGLVEAHYHNDGNGEGWFVTPLVPIYCGHLLKKGWISKNELLNILSTSNGNSDEETRRLMEYFWGYSVPADLPRTTDPAVCQFHEFVEITLFHTPELRCRFCDVKKSKAQKKD